MGNRLKWYYRRESVYTALVFPGRGLEGDAPRFAERIWEGPKFVETLPKPGTVLGMVIKRETLLLVAFILIFHLNW